MKKSFLIIAILALSINNLHAKEATIRRPIATKPTAKQPAAAARQPIATKPTVRQPTTTTKPALRQPAVRQPITAKPTPKKPTPRQPIATKPTASQPAASKLTSFQKWNTFKARGIKTIRLTHTTKGNQFKVHMKGIKAALEKADIDENVSVFLYVGDKQVASLGSYSPNKPGGGMGKAIFNQMPPIKNINLPQGQNAPAGENATLVFKNTSGGVAAKITTKILQGNAAWKDNTSIPR